MAATPSIELGMEVLQTSALPLGYVAATFPNPILPARSGPPYSWRDVAEPAFLDVMAHLPAGVVVISTRAGEEFRGLTASSLVSISLEPPMVLVGLERESLTRAAILDHKAFNVSLLTRSQEFIADPFARTKRARALIQTHQSLGGALFQKEHRVLEIRLELLRDRVDGLLRRRLELLHAHPHA